MKKIEVQAAVWALLVQTNNKQKRMVKTIWSAYVRIVVVAVFVIQLEGIEIVPLYLAAPRPTVERGGLILMVDDDRFPLESGEEPVVRSIRFRTLGCYPLTGAIQSNASTLTEVIQEMLLTTTSERQGRAIDKEQGASLEFKKQQGYF